MLWIGATVKDNVECADAELVYGTSLRLPGFYGKTVFTLNSQLVVGDFVPTLEGMVQHVHPVCTRGVKLCAPIYARATYMWVCICTCRRWQTSSAATKRWYIPRSPNQYGILCNRLTCYLWHCFAGSIQSCLHCTWFSCVPHMSDMTNWSAVSALSLLFSI